MNGSECKKSRGNDRDPRCAKLLKDVHDSVHTLSNGNSKASDQDIPNTADAKPEQVRPRGNNEKPGNSRSGTDRHDPKHASPMVENLNLMHVRL